ncbi:MAG: hypothetical protein CXT78_10675 [Thaumarchaeota archaeon]|nr:MAG: hypothetical protein CXT78_10675 [Nitrososphaerota archaeon]
MNLIDKFQNTLQCICNNHVNFEIIDSIECNWGHHIVIQCPVCEELFSIDKKCHAFQNILKLLKNNPQLYSENEQSNYLSNSH